MLHSHIACFLMVERRPDSCPPTSHTRTCSWASWIAPASWRIMCPFLPVLSFADLAADEAKGPAWVCTLPSAINREAGNIPRLCALIGCSSVFRGACVFALIVRFVRRSPRCLSCVSVVCDSGAAARGSCIVFRLASHRQRALPPWREGAALRSACQVSATQLAQPVPAQQFDQVIALTVCADNAPRHAGRCVFLHARASSESQAQVW